MVQQAKYSKPADMLGSSSVSFFQPSRNCFADCILYWVPADLSVLSSTDDSRKNQGAVMSKEEWKILDELENDIERDLEEEIKDGIYRLALRLHRLYQHRRERNGKVDVSESGTDNKDKALSEVNISIKMDGGTKIEIKETKKEAPDHHRKGLPLTPRSCRSNNVQCRLGSNDKKFDWAKSLRTGAGPAIVNRKIERSDQAKKPSNDRGFGMNINQLENTRRNRVSASGKKKGNPGLNRQD